MSSLNPVCIRCGKVILGDGTEEADWSVICEQCNYEELSDDELDEEGDDEQG